MLGFLFMVFMSALQGLTFKELFKMSGSVSKFAAIVALAQANQAAAQETAARVNAHLALLARDNDAKDAQIAVLQAQMEKLKASADDTTADEAALQAVIDQMTQTQTEYQQLDKSPAVAPAPVDASAATSPSEVANTDNAKPDAAAPVTTANVGGVSAADGSVPGAAASNPPTDGEGNTPAGASVAATTGSPSAGVGAFAPGASPIA